MTLKRFQIHDQELKRLLSFVGLFGLLSAASYVVPGLELVRPWVPGEPVPLVHLALDRAIVTENHLGELVRRSPDLAVSDLTAPDYDSGDPDAFESPSAPRTLSKVPATAESTSRVADAVATADPEASAETSPPSEARTDLDAPAAITDRAPSTSQPVIVADATASPADTTDLSEGSDAPPQAFSSGDAAHEAAETEGSAAPPSTDALPSDVPQVATLAPPAAAPGISARVVVEIPDQKPIEQAYLPDDVARPGHGNLRDRAPAHGTPMEVPPGSLDAWFTSLAKAAAGVPDHIARALHWGDSTIAGDGITRTVRSRMQARFGDGGPGFLAVQVDPRWASRPGVLRNAKGAWKTRTITFGGAGNKYYGLGGTVSTAYGRSSSTLGGSKVGDQRQALHRFDIAFQNRPDGGTLVVQVEGGDGATFQTKSGVTMDAFHTLTAPGGSQKLHVASNGDGPVTIYGVALETRGPGMTWETLGVAGAGQGSMFRQGPNHLARQVAWRKPDLLVYQMGGNELGYPSLKTGGGKVWKERYVRVVRSVRAGAPEASCLLITPLDQGERIRGTVRSKPTMATMVRLQRETAREMGCAFWDAQAAMGGSGSFGVWLTKKLAWSDLYHLTNKGLALIGHTLADAMEAAYDEWQHGTAGGGVPSGGPSAG